jgi:nitrogen regulatory protein P-II 1
MKKLEAVINPFKLDDVKTALLAIGVVGVTSSEVKGYGRQKGAAELYRGAEHTYTFVSKVKVEIVVPAALVGRVIEVVERTVRTGRIGDGKIFVTPVEAAVRVRTGERGEEAL